MIQIKTRLRRWVNRLDQRFTRTRPASVLVMVVVLLVLMALIGTAYLVTARNDRIASKLYERNVQIDMLLTGVENLAIAQMTDTSYQSAGANYFDDWFTAAPSTPSQSHTWLASRYPEIAAGSTLATVSNLIGVLGVTSTPGPVQPRYPVPAGAMVIKSTIAPANTQIYLSMHDNNLGSVVTGPDWQAPVGLPILPTGVPYWPALTSALAPNSIFEDPRSPTVANRPDGVRTVVSPTFQNVGGINLPALTYWSTYNQRVETAIAASASGNGIADSFLWRLPVGTVDGITYYAAVRIIDGNSAVNLNTANSAATEFTYNGGETTRDSTNHPIDPGFTPSIFPSEIGISELTFTFQSTGGSSLNTSATVPTDYGASMTELAALNAYRFNNGSFAVGTALQYPAGILGDTSTTPIDDAQLPHTEFAYHNLGDALWMGLGRRIGNPGVCWGTAGAFHNYQSLGWTESAQLAYRFDLINAYAPPSIAEKCLSGSLYNRNTTIAPPSPFNIALTPGGANSGPFRTSPFDPSDANPTWISGYKMANASPVSWTTNQNMRAFFVARNPVSNAMPAHRLNDGTDLPVSATSFVLPFGIENLMLGAADPVTGLVRYSDKDAKQHIVPKVSLNTADITAFDASTTNLKWAYGSPTPSMSLAAKVPTLWFGFYNAMLDAFPPAIAATTQNPNFPAAIPLRSGTTIPNVALPSPGIPAQFRSPLRDPSGASFMDAPNVLLLRSLIAACNAKDLRDSDETPTTVHIPAGTGMSVNGAATPVSVNVFGTERQVFVTEIYASNEINAPAMIGAVANPDAGKMNPKGYVAIELHNPYDYDIDLTGWALRILTRSTYPSMALLPIAGNQPFLANQGAPPTVQQCKIPARGYLVLENYNEMTSGAAGGNDATYRPWTHYLNAIAPDRTTHYFAGGGLSFYVRNLHTVLADTALGTIGGELVLLRPTHNGTISPPTIPNYLPAPPDISYQFAPVDSFDFNGLAEVQPTEKLNAAIHYVRANSGAIPNVATDWKFVYPGRWDAVRYVVGAHRFHQEGIQLSEWDPTTLPNPQPDIWIATPPPTGIYLGGADPTPSYVNNFPGIQVANIDFGGSSKMSDGQSGTFYQFPTAPPTPGTTPAAHVVASYAPTTPNKKTFPFGGFSRVGDVLQVPFIGAYTLMNAANGTIIEMNTVSSDCAFADDLDVSSIDDPIEQVGRFCPLLATEPTRIDVTPFIPNYVTPAPTGLVPYPIPVLQNDRYGWANNILNYFTTISNPNDCYFPNVDPYAYGRWVGGSAWAPLNYTTKVFSSGQPGHDFGDLSPVDGQININTASALVLGNAVPFFPPFMDNQNPFVWQGGPTLGPVGPFNSQPFNQTIATGIVSFRNAYGPFRTLFDLNKVFTCPPGTDPTTNRSAQWFQNTYGHAVGVAPPAPGTLETYRGGAVGNGDLAPYMGPNFTGTYPQSGFTAQNDFEPRFAMINRVSNLLTTRSDTYTVYVLVQGWSGVGTPNPLVVAQRRSAFIIDRSLLTPLNRTPNRTQVNVN